MGNGDTHSDKEPDISHELDQELESWQVAASEALAGFESSLLSINNNYENADNPKWR